MQGWWRVNPAKQFTHFCEMQNSGYQPEDNSARRLTRVIQLCNLMLWCKLQELARVELMQVEYF